MSKIFTLHFWSLLPKVLWREYPVACVFMAITVLLFSCSEYWATCPNLFIPAFLTSLLGCLSFITIRNIEKNSGKPVSELWKYGVFIALVIELTYFVLSGYYRYLLHFVLFPPIIFLGMAFLSHIRDKDDSLLRNHTMGIVVSCGLAAIFSAFVIGVALLAFWLLYAPLSSLTDVEFPFSFVIMLVTFVASLSFGVIIMKNETFQNYKKINCDIYPGNIFAKIFLTATTYMILVLYLYMIIILFRLELPRGYLSMVVSICTIIGLFTYTGCRKQWLETQKKVWQNIHKAIPWLLIPLQVIMTIAIARRICDYGVTITRVYGLILNVWFYGICLYLALSKCKKVKWVPISFIIVLFLSICSPLNVVEYVKYQLRYDIEHNRGRCYDKYRYLNANFGEGATRNLAEPDSIVEDETFAR